MYMYIQTCTHIIWHTHTQGYIVRTNMHTHKVHTYIHTQSIPVYTKTHAYKHIPHAQGTHCAYNTQCNIIYMYTHAHTHTVMHTVAACYCWPEVYTPCTCTIPHGRVLKTCIISHTTPNTAYSHNTSDNCYLSCIVWRFSNNYCATII